MKALRICGAVFAAFLIILAFALSAFADDVGIVNKDDVKGFVKKLGYSPWRQDYTLCTANEKLL